MKALALVVGGLVSGLVIVIGEVALNLWLLADEWAGVLARFQMPAPTAAVALQGVLKLLVLGFFTTWLAVKLEPAFANRTRAAITAGLVVWFLVWAWVQWGMYLAGYVTGQIALVTVLWGVVELPVAAWLGMLARDRMARFLTR